MPGFVVSIGVMRLEKRGSMAVSLSDVISASETGSNHCPGRPAPRLIQTHQAATFVYVDAHQTTDSELRAWGTAHMPLWSALRARTFAVHVVAVGLGADAADRAAPVLKHWTQDGDGTGTDNPTGQTQADPDIRQEIARLKAGITVGDRADLAALGGFSTAAKRLKTLRQLPEGTPTKTTTHGTIDRFQIWSSLRLTTPELSS